jgi:hypothetical protein
VALALAEEAERLQTIVAFLGQEIAVLRLWLAQQVERDPGIRVLLDPYAQAIADDDETVLPLLAA